MSSPLKTIAIVINIYFHIKYYLLRVKSAKYPNSRTQNFRQILNVDVSKNNHANCFLPVIYN